MVDSIIEFANVHPWLTAMPFIAMAVAYLFMLNNRDTLRCRILALDAIRDYNIDGYVLYGRDKWKRLNYEKVMQPYSYTWFAFVKNAEAVIRPQYLDKLGIYFENAKKFRRFD